MTDATRRLIQLSAAAAFIVTVLLLIGLLVWSDQPAVRYATLPCVYREIYGRTSPVDVVVVGTSRANWGVSASGLSAGLAAEGRGPAVVVNLSRSWRGTQQMLQEVRDIENARGIRRAIVVEYEREGNLGDTTQTYYDYHPDTASALPLSELAHDPQLKPREPAYLRLRDQLELWQRRIDVSLTQWKTGLWRVNAGVPTTVGVSEGCAGFDRAIEREHLAAYAAERTRRFGSWQRHAPVAWGMGAINADAQRVSVHEFVAFARAHHVGIYFLAMPRYLDPPVSQAFVHRFERRFGAPLLAPPPSILAQLYVRGFSDPNHMWKPGRDIYTQWLATQIR